MTPSPSPGSTDRKDVWASFAQGTGRHDARLARGDPDHPGRGRAQAGDYATAAVPGQTGPLTSTLGVHDDIVAFNTGGHQAAIRKFLDFAYQDKYQLQFDKEYDLLPATQSAAARCWRRDPMFAAFLSNIPNSVNYPSAGQLDHGGEPDQDHARPGHHRQPAGQVLSAIQQTATSSG